MISKERIANFNKNHDLHYDNDTFAAICDQARLAVELQAQNDELKRLLTAPKGDVKGETATKVTLYLQGKEYDIPTQMYEAWMRIQEIEKENETLRISQNDAIDSLDRAEKKIQELQEKLDKIEAANNVADYEKLCSSCGGDYARGYFSALYDVEKIMRGEV